MDSVSKKYEIFATVTVEQSIELGDVSWSVCAIVLVLVLFILGCILCNLSDGFSVVTVNSVIAELFFPPTQGGQVEVNKHVLYDADLQGEL